MEEAKAKEKNLVNKPEPDTEPEPIQEPPKPKSKPKKKTEKPSDKTENEISLPPKRKPESGK